MGAFDGKTRSDFAFSEETRSQSNFSMDSGFGNMVDKFAGLGVNASSNDSLFQVIKAVEAAENTIRQQVEDNNNLRIQLQKRTEDLERYVVIPYGHATTFSILSSGMEHLLQTTTNNSAFKDAIVLTMKLFIAKVDLNMFNDFPIH